MDLTCLATEGRKLTASTARARKKRAVRIQRLSLAITVTYVLGTRVKWLCSALALSAFGACLPGRTGRRISVFRAMHLRKSLSVYTTFWGGRSGRLFALC